MGSYFELRWFIPAFPWFILMFPWFERESELGAHTRTIGYPLDKS